MSDLRVFIDFGSTFTKVVAFDLGRELLLGRVQAPSTVDTDVNLGLDRALNELRRTVDVAEADIASALACSSAAGGLRMACIGLVPEYTTEAGRLAALGAGAKVVASYSYEMTQEELRALEELDPDIVLLTGGTDGGNRRTILHNASLLASSRRIRNIIAAGNKSAGDSLREIFRAAGREAVFTENVMPEFGRLNTEPVNAVIREMFIGRITEAKGVDRARERIGSIVMPTPSAVLAASKALADGTYAEAGLGPLLVVDVGGATTDVYSVAEGVPRKAGVGYVGLPEPYAKRSVEGDLGLFHNLDTLAALASEEHLEFQGGESREEVLRGLHQVLGVPAGDAQTRDQLLLSRLAVKTAVDRHVGRLECRATLNGETWFQRGKDLTELKTVLGAGGPLAFSADPLYVLRGAADSPDPSILKPKGPRFLLDKRYILFAVGLLSLSEPEKALRIFKKYMVELAPAGE